MCGRVWFQNMKIKLIVLGIVLDLITIPVPNISLDDHHIHILDRAALICYDNLAQVTYESLNFLRLSKFQVNSTRNKFTVVGCSTLALITGSRVQNYTTGCVSLCDGVESVVDGSCSGIGCCQTSLPVGARDFQVEFRVFNNSALVDIPCSSAFVAQEGNYTFSSTDLNTGYRCNCPSGYEGNPYLINGCTDIDECATVNPCSPPATCLNQPPGRFQCICPRYNHTDDEKGCEKISQAAGSGMTGSAIAIGVSTSLFVLVLGSVGIYWLLAKRRHIKQREKFFAQNGGFMLREQLSKNNDLAETTRLFTEERTKLCS